jgi:hypothetical protein
LSAWSQERPCLPLSCHLIVVLLNSTLMLAWDSHLCWQYQEKYAWILIDSISNDIFQFCCQP